MSLVQYAERGSEHFIPYAEKKLRELHDYMIQSGVAAFSKRIDVSTGAAIYINSLAMGQGVFVDKIRITTGVSISGTMSSIINVASLPDINSSLLDPEREDFGLVLPRDIRGLPASFKAGGVLEPPDPNAGAYRGMIVNIPFLVQYPVEYVSPGVATYLHLASSGTDTVHFRYLPGLNNGTFMIGGENSITWVSGANNNANADLNIYVLPAPQDTFTDDPTIYATVATTTEYRLATINSSAEIMAKRVTFRHDILDPGSLQRIEDGTPGLWNPWLFIEKFEAIRYMPDVLVPRVEISYAGVEPSVVDLGANRWRYTGSSTNSEIAVARYGAVSYMAVAETYYDRTVDLQGDLVTSHDYSATISLMHSVLVNGIPDGVGEYIIEKEVFTDITSPPDWNFLTTTIGGLIVKRGPVSGVEDQQMYLMMYGSVDINGGVSSAYLRSHIGTNDLGQTEGTMGSIGELTADISADIAYVAPSYNSEGVETDPGRAAQAPIPACVFTTGSGIWAVKIWGVPKIEITGTASDYAACRWTPDARYLCVKIAGALYVYTPDGTEIARLPDADQFFVPQRSSISFSLTDEVTCFQVTGSDGSYTAFTIGPIGVSTRAFTIADGAFTQEANVQVQGSRAFFVDDTRRVYS